GRAALLAAPRSAAASRRSPRPAASPGRGQVVYASPFEKRLEVLRELFHVGLLEHRDVIPRHHIALDPALRELPPAEVQRLPEAAQAVGGAEEKDATLIRFRVIGAEREQDGLLGRLESRPRVHTQLTRGPIETAPGGAAEGSEQRADAGGHVRQDLRP